MESQSDLLLEKWGLPLGVLEFYKKRGIRKMLRWQVECLTKGSVLKGGNLIYSAPTSAGKTLVAEILISQCVFERQKKALIILPFVSVVREKMFYFQEMYSENGARVEGFMGGHTPSASFQQVQVAVCTIEKANALINRMLEEKNLDLLGAVVVDELHLLGDPYRGYLLELLLTKLKFISQTSPKISLQIIGMSATLPNLHMLAEWLNANLYFTDFRPVPLREHMKCGKNILNAQLEPIREISTTTEGEDDSEQVGYLCIETIKAGRSVLIFCPTKLWCENLAIKLSSYFRKLGCGKNAINEGSHGWILRQQLDLNKLKIVLDHLKMCPVGLDKDLEKTVPFGVAFHHAGLTLDERDVIEGSFRNGSLRVLCATSTLSSGVNLPARRVIIRSPMSFGGVMDVMTYRQMIGRAGRMGVDTEGESLLICKRGEERIGAQLIRANLRPIASCLGSSRLSASLKRAILEAIGGGLAATTDEVIQFAGATFLAVCSPADIKEPLAACLTFLSDNELIRRKSDRSFSVTPLGEACLASSLPPDEGLALFMELDRARRCFVLDSDLHIIYQITPFSVSEQWTKIDWLRMLEILEKFSQSMRRVAELVGVEDSFLVKVVKGKINLETPENRTKLSIHRRFYTALALQDLVMEVPLTQVAHNFDCNKGMLQSLQQSAATYAGMVAEFARRLRWSTIELIVSEFQERLQFGVQRELCELMRLPSLSAVRARSLFNSGITTLPQIASSEIADLENAFQKAIPFHDDAKHIWITGRAGISINEAANILRKEAREALELELGVQANWTSAANSSKSFIKLTQTQTTIEDLNKPSILQCKTQLDQKKSLKSETTGASQASISGLEALLESSDWTSQATSAYEKSTVMEEKPQTRPSRTSCDLFECHTPVSNPIRPVIDSPDIFNQSLTFDTQLERICDADPQPELPCSPVKSDDMGYLSNSSSIIIEHSIEDAAGFQTVGESFFFQDKRKRTDSVQIEMNQTKRHKTVVGSGRDKDKEGKVKPQIPNDQKMQWDKFHIIDVGQNEQVFESFGRELAKEKIIALSVACRRKTEAVKKIGANIGSSTGLNKKEDKFTSNDIIIDGFAVYWHLNYVFYVPCHDQGLSTNKIQCFIQKLSDCGKTIRMFDSREQLRLLGFVHLRFHSYYQDPKVAAWLINAGGTEQSLRSLVNEQLPQGKCFAEYLGSSAGVGSPGLNTASDESPRHRACSEALLTYHLLQQQLIQLEAIKLVQVFREIEMPIIGILSDMEVCGLKFNETQLKAIKNQLEILCTRLELKAYSIAGRKFALSSHTAVAKILYSELRLGKHFKNKQTNKESLELLQSESNNPLPGVILQWRKLKAIVNKTLCPLLRLLPATRIHGTCKTFTTTGRISMSEPNLQNVARDFDVDMTSIRLRQVFIAETGSIFLSADYCQIELRLLAELSKDHQLIKDITETSDVFQSIASNIFGVEKATAEQRQRAKQICYGIIYGIGARSLAQQLLIEISDAQQLMDDFNAKYHDVRAFVKKSVADCRKHGYVSTLKGRRRYLPGINSLDGAARSEAERQAVNTRIQGSAADLVKTAMCQVAHNSKAFNGKKMRLVMQLHDEVMYEVDKDIVKYAAAVLKKHMEGAASVCGLGIPFPVKLKFGPSWDY